MQLTGSDHHKLQQYKNRGHHLGEFKFGIGVDFFLD